MTGDLNRAKFYHTNVFCQSLTSSNVRFQVHEAPSKTLCSKCCHMTVLTHTQYIYVYIGGGGCSRDTVGGGSQ